MGTSQSKIEKLKLEASQAKIEEFKKLLEDSIFESIYPSPDAQVIKAASKRPTKPPLQDVQAIELDVQAIQGSNESTTNALDGRTQVLETAKWPNSVHGLIIYKATTWGTGIMIGPHVVLTTGHHLYNSETRAFIDVKSMQFLPGINGQVLPFGLVEVEQYFVSPNYIKNGKEDYGILILKKPIGEVTGYFGLACLEPEEIKEKKINITVSASDKVASKPRIHEIWGMEGTASYIDKENGEINYIIDTAGGQSGSGIWYQEGEDYYVCGVHAKGTHLVNSATMLTRSMYQQIYEWMHQGHFKKSILTLRSNSEKKFKFKNQEINADCISLLREYNLNDLTHLDFGFNRIRGEGAKALAENTSWTNLSELNLGSNNIGAEGAKALAENTSWINLSKLDLHSNNIGDEGAKAFAQNTSWIYLSVLDLSSNNIGNEGTKALAQNTSWINLSELDLSDNNIGTEGLKALAQNTSWINLSRLRLTFNNIGAEGVKALAENTSWINLSRLWFSNNNIGVEGVKGLAQNTSWINLSELDLSYNNIGNEGVKALAQNTSWINLSELYLEENNIGNEGVKALAENTSWINLSMLCLTSNNIGNEGAKALAENTSWINLSMLDLTSNSIGAEGAAILKQNKTWKQPIFLDY